MNAPDIPISDRVAETGEPISANVIAWQGALGVEFNFEGGHRRNREIETADWTVLERLHLAGSSRSPATTPSTATARPWRKW